MDATSPGFFLRLALCFYGLGALGSLAALRRERIATVAGCGSAMLASICGIWAALLKLGAEAGSGEASFELWHSPIPGLKLTLELDALGAFFVLILSILALALS